MTTTTLCERLRRAAGDRDRYWMRLASLRALLREAVELMPLDAKKRQAWFGRATEELSRQLQLEQESRP